MSEDGSGESSPEDRPRRIGEAPIHAAERPRGASEVAFILVEPEHAWNVGSVARAMSNLGFDDLRIVGPSQPDWGSSPDATRAAHGALDILEGASRHAELAEAIADRAYLVGTSARRREVRRSHRLDLAFADRMAGEDRIGILFGSERTGLANDALARCHEVIHIPTWGEQWSLNLSQAVLLVGYTLREYVRAEAERPKRTRPVERQLEHTFGRLDEALEEIGFWKPGLEDRSRDHLRRVLLRGVESTQELGLLERLAHRIRLYAEGTLGRGGEGEPTDEPGSVESE